MQLESEGSWLNLTRQTVNLGTQPYYKASSDLRNTVISIGKVVCGAAKQHFKKSYFQVRVSTNWHGSDWNINLSLHIIYILYIIVWDAVCKRLQSHRLVQIH